MGEVVVLSSQSAEAMAGSGAEAAMKDESLNGVGVRWERFLQRMMLRVLLVEADDSTRQIISALLRKCGYRVAAVPDGLKAWEMLKGRSSSIDLILTEVDLPSICGFALLTLIMEHDICKTIPVIMMSSQDSISTVYKCMMKGAADYLVKPIRRNELRNLWQHVWRRQSVWLPHSTAQRVEVTSENEPASNANVHSPKACGEKGSDAQSSSCKKPDLESERQESSQANHGRSFPGPSKLHSDEIDINSCQKSIMRENEAAGFDFVTIENAMDKMRGAEVETHNMDTDISCGNANNATALVRSSRNTTNLIGAFGDYRECNHRNCSSSNGTSNFDNASGLDLSLRRCHSSNIEHNLVTETHTLRTSNASAFSRYSHRPIQHLELKFIEENRANLYNMATGYTPYIYDPRLNIQPKKTCPSPVQVKGVQFNVPGSGYGSVLSPIICAQSGLSPLTSPSTAAYPMNSFHQSNLENIDSEKLGEQLHRDSNNAARILSIADSKKEEADLESTKDLHRSSQREAALTKFRLKRKDRCFEKKVRYESRKKLAEQRPRVKGQFVRQLNGDSRPPQTAEN